MPTHCITVRACSSLVFILALGACSGSGGTRPLSASLPETEDGAATAPGLASAWVVNLKDTTGIEQIAPQLASKRVVFVGETHTRYEHHLAQLAIIRRMYAAHPDLAIGMEYFQAPFQSYLDAYVAGELDEAGLLRGTEYFERWRFDWRLYRPILGFAREHGIPVVALNVPKELTGRIGKVGIEGLSDEERARLPVPLPPPDAAYRERLEQSFRQHPKSAQRDFERFVQVQSVWDEGMAQRVAEYLDQHPRRRMVVLAGAGHLVYGQGIPDRVRRRTATSTAVVLPGPDGEDLSPDLADYALWTPPVELPAQGLMGVFLGEDDEPGVEVAGLADASPAQKAGLREGDRIAALDGKAVQDLTDLKLALLDRRPGDRVEVTVARTGTAGSEQRTVHTLTLQGNVPMASRQLPPHHPRPAKPGRGHLHGEP